MSNSEKKECILCNIDSNKVPLVQLHYQDKNYWICPQHIPILIHQPDKLEGIIPGAENFQAG